MPLSISGDRKSKNILNETYFWTNSIKDWNEILWNETFKDVIVQSLMYLTKKNFVRIYAFVIMPNHIHLIWKMLKKNGDELPIASFSKYTAHQLLEKVKNDSTKNISRFLVDECDREHRIWHRDPLAILMDSRAKVEQKIKYIHDNPMGEKWNLAKYPEDYYWSSASFYETGKDHFGFLTHYREEF